MADPDGIAAQVAACGGPDGLNLPGWEGQKLDEQVAAVKRAWQQPIRRLLIFDNLEEPRLLPEWRPTGGGAQVLITSRNAHWPPTLGVQQVPLRPLARAESMRLLLAPRAQARGEAVETLLADAGVATVASAICDQLGDLPLALALAGAYLHDVPNLPLAAYQRQLAQTLLDNESLSDELAREALLPTAYPRGVAAAIQLSYDRLDPQRDRDAAALALLHRLAWLAPAPVPHPLLVALAGGDPAEPAHAAAADPALRRLREVGLVDTAKEGAILHRLVAAYARRRDQMLSSVRRRDPAAGASRTAAVEATLAAVARLDIPRAPLAAEPYRPHLLALCDRSDELEHLLAARVLDTSGELLYHQGDYAAARPLYERALAIAERALGPEHPTTQTVRQNLQQLLRQLGEA